MAWNLSLVPLVPWKIPTYQDPFPTYQGHPPQWMDLFQACCWRFPFQTAWTLGVATIRHQFTFSILCLMFQTDRKEEILEFQLHHNEWISRRCYSAFSFGNVFVIPIQAGVHGVEIHKATELVTKNDKKIYIGLDTSRKGTECYRPICGNFVGHDCSGKLPSSADAKSHDRIMDSSTRIHRWPMKIYIKLGASSPLP